MPRAILTAFALAACGPHSALDASIADAGRDAVIASDAGPDARDPKPCDRPLGSECDRAAASCEAAAELSPIAPGVAHYGNLPREELLDAGPFCPEDGVSRFMRLRVPTTSDVRIEVAIDQPDLPRRSGVDACVLGCAPEPGEPLPSECCPASFYQVLLESECGDGDTQLLEGTSGGLGCFASGPAGIFADGYNGLIHLIGLYIPAGDYIIEIRGQGTGDYDRPFSVTAYVEPSQSPACSASPLEIGIETIGSTVEGSDAFRFDCFRTNDPSLGNESIHPFTLAERSRVRVLTTADAPIRTRILDRCAIEAAELACQRTECTGGDSLEAVLEPGTHYALIEGAAAREIAPARYYEAGPIDYRVELSIEPADLACSDATAIEISATYSHTTTGEPDRIRMPRRYPSDCEFFARLGDAPDRAYTFALDAPSAVRFALTNHFENASIALYRGCGEALVAGGARVTEIEEMLEAGMYSVFVGGGAASDAGSYDLEVALGI